MPASSLSQYHQEAISEKVVIDVGGSNFENMLFALNNILGYYMCLSGGSCAPNTSPADMETYFGSVINEYRSGKQLTSLDQTAVNDAIDTVVDQANDMRSTLLAELGAAAAAQAGCSSCRS